MPRFLENLHLSDMWFVQLFKDDTTDDIHTQTEDLCFNIYIFLRSSEKLSNTSQAGMGHLPFLGDLRLCQRLWRIHQRLPFLGVVDPHLQGLLHDLPVPHVGQLLLFRSPGIQPRCLTLALYRNICVSAAALSHVWSHWLSHTWVAIWKDTEAFNWTNC